MAVVEQVSGDNTNPQGGGTERDIPCGNSPYSLQSLQINAQVTNRIAGVRSHLYCKVPTNTAAHDTAITFRINGSNGFQAISVLAGTTGEFEDVSNVDAIISGDEINYRVVVGAGGGAITIELLRTLFAASVNTAGIYVANTQQSGLELSEAGSSYYCLTDAMSGVNTNEAFAQTQINTPATGKRLFVYAPTNTILVGSTTIRTRKNGGIDWDGPGTSMFVTYTAGVSGILEDLSRTDSIAVGDEYNTAVVMVNDAVLSFELQTIAVTLETTNGKSQCVGGEASFGMGAVSVTNYATLSGGGPFSGGSETNHAVETDIPQGYITNAQCYVSANSRASGSTFFRVRKNAAASVVVVTITNGVTGFFQDAVNRASFRSGDELNLGLILLIASGSLTLRTCGCLLQTLRKVSADGPAVGIAA